MNTGNYFQVPKKRLCKSFRLSMICQCNVTLLGFNDGPQQKTIVKDQQGMSLGDEFSTHKQPGVKGGCNASPNIQLIKCTNEIVLDQYDKKYNL